MSEFKVGDKVWVVHMGAGREEDDFYGVVGALTVYEYNPNDDCPYFLGRESGTGWYERKIVFATRREALAEAIRLNEGLASALTMEIARLKEELKKEPIREWLARCNPPASVLDEIREYRANLRESEKDSS